MTSPPRLRKLLLTTHVTFSVGWLGAVAAYLALAITGVTHVELGRSTHPSMELIGWLVIVPCSVGALVSGLVQSLATDWGLFRHWWIVAKLVLTVGGTTILLMHIPAVSRMAAVASSNASSVAAGRLPLELVIHAAGGLVVLLAATTLSVFKPWGRTPYGRRKQA